MKLRKVADKSAGYDKRSEQEILADIAKLEKQMFALAKDLEFEKAAALRDDIEALRATLTTRS